MNTLTSTILKINNAYTDAVLNYKNGKYDTTILIYMLRKNRQLVYDVTKNCINLAIITTRPNGETDKQIVTDNTLDLIIAAYKQDTIQAKIINIAYTLNKYKNKHNLKEDIYDTLSVRLRNNSKQAIS